LAEKEQAEDGIWFGPDGGSREYIFSLCNIIRKMQILFATSNPHKVEEVRKIGRDYGIEFIRLAQSYPEIRDEDVERVAEDGAKQVYEAVKKPVVVDDTGLYIDALKGFPGPFSSYVFKKIGCEGILRLMDKADNRGAVFVSAVGYCDGKRLLTFRGECRGTITDRMRGPASSDTTPYSSRTERKNIRRRRGMKDRVSHRRKSFDAFCRWYTADSKTG